MARIEFGIFDHLDRRPDIGLAQTYEDRLRLIEAYDRAGFATYQIAEHHATPLTVAPAPSVFLAAVAQRTTRMRFGPMVYVLPLYHPIRLIEEICMLDQMSGGRLDLGYGRGISRFELSYFGIDPDKSRDISDEILACVLAGLADGDRLNFKGKHFSFDDVPLHISPVQTPHPPLWTGVGSMDGAARSGAKGENILTNSPLDSAADMMARYKEAFYATRDEATPLPRMAVCRHMYIAETDSEAEAVMREAYAAWYNHFVALWRIHGAAPVVAQYTDNFEETCARDLLIFGTPDKVREEIERYLETSGTNYFTCRFAYGSLSYEQSRRALDLFTEEVMPHFA